MAGETLMRTSLSRKRGRRCKGCGSGCKSALPRPPAWQNPAKALGSEAMIEQRGLRPAQPASPRGMLVTVHRAVAELRRGEPVVLANADGRSALVLAAEMVSGPALARLRKEGGRLHLALSGPRAAALGGVGLGNGPVAIPLAPEIDPEQVVALADPTRNGSRPDPGRLFGPVDSASVEMAEAAIQLMRIA